jgi:hypothetical protein
VTKLSNFAFSDQFLTSTGDHAEIASKLWGKIQQPAHRRNFTKLQVKRKLHTVKQWSLGYYVL